MNVYDAGVHFPLKNNIFLDEKCFFVGLEEDVEVRPEKFNIDLCIFDSLLSSSL